MTLHGGGPSEKQTNGSAWSRVTSPVQNRGGIQELSARTELEDHSSPEHHGSSAGGTGNIMQDT